MRILKRFETKETIRPLFIWLNLELESMERAVYFLQFKFHSSETWKNCTGNGFGFKMNFYANVVSILLKKVDVGFFCLRAEKRNKSFSSFRTKYLNKIYITQKQSILILKYLNCLG